MESAEHDRNLSDCKAGRETCQYAKLTEKEAGALAGVENARNYRACLKGFGYATGPGSRRLSQKPFLTTLPRPSKNQHAALREISNPSDDSSPWPASSRRYFVR